jgi:hypothetical protein
MKNIFFTFLSLLFTVSVNAQLINDGATIVIEDGATLFIEGSLQNNLTGSITIQGTGIVEVEGDVTIAPTSTVTMSNNAKIILSGPNASNFTSGGASFTNIEMDKTANNVNLMDEMRISTNLNFVGDNNKLILGDHNLVFAPNATISSADANEYILADGNANTGVVSKELSASEVFKFEIGDATNYTPLDADISGTGFSSATVNVNVVPLVQPNKPSEASDFISRYWNVDQSGVTDYSADLEGTYVAGDLTGTAGDVKGAHYGANWTYEGAAAGANSAIGTVSESGDFTGTNSFGKVGLTLFLQGAYSGGSSMSTSLNSSGILETFAKDSPYNGAISVPAGFFAANPTIVDWIEIEVRDAGTPGTVLSTHSAFLRNDGVVLGLDGSPNPLLKNAPSTGYIGINHRNHLSVNTAAALNLASVGFDTHNFSSSLAQAYDNPAIVNNDAMVDLGSGIYGLFRGDANGNNTINILDAAVARNGSVPIQTGVYSDLDVNMNATVNVVDAAVAKSASVPIKTAHVQ